LLQKDATLQKTRKRGAWRRVFALQQRLEAQPLLTGNGIPASFSVLVPSTFKDGSHAVGAPQ
jgi:hypothetical protein